MWAAAVLCLLSGLVVGYLYAKVFLRRSDSAQDEENKQKLQQQVEKYQQLQKELSQENAELKYLLGEEKKARAYAENKRAG